MRLAVRVIPRAKRAGVESLSDGSLRVRVTQPAQDGRANDAVLEALAEHFGVPRRCVSLVRGASSRQKVVEITE